MVLQNEFIKATVQKKGAELVSLILKETGQEYIWQADPAHWARHTPVLFPFVGRLKNDEYHFEGKKYSMGQHGFARDMEFEVESQSENNISFLLTSSEETLRKYPFQFELRIVYTLEGKSIQTQYHVKNTGRHGMYFSIGGHPAFKCAMTLAGKRSDYQLRFNKPEDAAIHLLEDGIFSGETDNSILKKGIIPITDELFDRDALVFKHLKSTNVSLVSMDKTWLKFHFQGFPYLGIWSKNQVSRFVCIEPWFGIADHKDHDGDLAKKEGIMSLDSDKSFNCDYRIEIE
ncbi:aldose 1-epimerase family protein [Marinoscillum sp. MHG1-6]|uniref:aldose 1-epimerase family protein n=1 Tax=Marinoscillum sp. MHG1-6 TaxID=2959627 RepID=UPI00215705C5|nr:aldose 1-epimerase family protein [Marinoscillum sp. MHG1-6]